MFVCVPCALPFFHVKKMIFWINPDIWKMFFPQIDSFITNVQIGLRSSTYLLSDLKNCVILCVILLVLHQLKDLLSYRDGILGCVPVSLKPPTVLQG